MRRYAVLSLAVLGLAACSQPAEQAASEGEDKFAGFEPQLVAWRAAIEAESPVCSQKTDGKGCQDFAVACKRERLVGADEAARGVTAKIVAAMTFQSRAADARAGSAIAEFSKAGGTWTRVEADPVNLATCQAAPHT